MSKHYIVTPVRNAVRTIDATIWSIVSQYGDLEIHYHVQDGGSTDGTLEKIQAWFERIERLSGSLPSRIYFTFDSKPDRGMYDAINTGFGSLVIPPDAFMNWCNADDALWPGALDAVSRLARDLPDVDWITGWLAWCDDLGRLTAIKRNSRYPQAILAAGLADGIHWPFIQQENIFWRKRLWDQVGGLDISFKLAGDWNLWTRFAQFSPLTHACRQLGTFYVRPGQQSSDITSYRAEMESAIPGRVRQASLCLSERQAKSLTTIQRAEERADGTWLLRRQNCKTVAGLVARLIKMMQVAPLLVIKAFYKLW